VEEDKRKPPKKDNKKGRDKSDKKGGKDNNSSRSPSATGRSKPKDRYVSGTPDPKICCYYFNNGNKCNKSKDECPFLHMSPGKDKIAEITGPKSKGSGKGKSAAPGEHDGRGRSRNRDKSTGRRIQISRQILEPPADRALRAREEAEGHRGGETLREGETDHPVPIQTKEKGTAKESDQRYAVTMPKVNATRVTIVRFYTCQRRLRRNMQRSAKG
jgi:hypothetical protein